MSALNPNTPVLVGVGQVVDHWDGADAAIAPDPARLRAIAGQRALVDSGAAETLAASIDRVVVIRTMADSIPGAPQPFGRCATPAATLAADLGIAAARSTYSVVGGDQPQALVNEAAAAIHAGEARAVLIAGGEATAAFKAAQRAGHMLDWSRGVAAAEEDRGFGKPLLSAYDIANGLGAPVITYPAFEHALRGRLGVSRRDYARRMAQLWARFSGIAATNPYSQFPVERSVDFLMTPSPENYPVADPYLKWHVAQDAVNQAAAVILTSVGEADRLGIAPEHRVFLHGHAEAAERVPSERPDLSRSRAVELVLARALAATGIGVESLAEIDLYSCFPCAVLIAAEALGVDPLARDLTVTGGLPFFGGPGNSYSLHAIASMVERLRAARDGFGLVLANGGFLSKQAAGVYAAVPPRDWAPVDNGAIAAEILAAPVPQLLSGAGEATITSYSVSFAKGAPTRGYVIGATEAGGRVIARVRRDDTAMLAALLADDPIGRRVRTDIDGSANVIAELLP